MKKVRIDGSNLKLCCELDISGSKSESNRILILKSIFKNIKIKEKQRHGKKSQSIGEFVLGTQIKKGSFL